MHDKEHLVDQRADHPDRGVRRDRWAPEQDRRHQDIQQAWVSTIAAGTGRANRQLGDEREQRMRCGHWLRLSRWRLFLRTELAYTTTICVGAGT